MIRGGPSKLRRHMGSAVCSQDQGAVVPDGVTAEHLAAQLDGDRIRNMGVDQVDARKSVQNAHQATLDVRSDKLDAHKMALRATFMEQDQRQASQEAAYELGLRSIWHRRL